MANISLNRQVFDKQQFENTVDTSFTQLNIPVTSSTTTTPPTIEQFFDFYNQLFYQIPKLGDTNSHSYLVKTSGEYIGNTQNDDVIQALIDEINVLRQQVLDLQTQTSSQTLTSLKNTLNNING
jgi:hypothetical protein